MCQAADRLASSPDRALRAANRNWGAREAARICPALSGLRLLRPTPDCLAQPRLLAGIGCHEIGRASGFADVFVRRRTSFGVVGFQEAVRRKLAQRAVELPGEIFRVLQARIGSTRAERGDLVRGIAGK